MRSTPSLHDLSFKMLVSQSFWNVLVFLVLEGVDGAAVIKPRAQRTDAAPKLVRRQSNTTYSLPQFASNVTPRVAAMYVTFSES